MPKVVIVTPTHNRSDLLVEALGSVDRQTFRDFVMVVADDASTDDTPAVMADQARAKPWLRSIRFDENVGACRARNAGWQSADADYVMFLDSDDLIHPEKLARQVEFLDENPAYDAHVTQMAHFGSQPGDDEFLWNTFVGGDPGLRFLGHDPVFGIHSPLWRRALIERLSGFEESLPMAQEFDLHTRAYAESAQIQLDPTLMAYCRRHDGASIGRDKRIRRMAVLDGEFDRLERLLCDRERLTPDAKHALTGNRLWIAQSAFYSGDVALGMSIMEKIELGNSAKRKFITLGKIIAKFTRHRIFMMMRDIALAHGHDLTTRERWLHAHRIDAEPGLVNPDFRA